MKLTFNNWGGIAPRLDPLRLPVGVAATSVNVRPDPYSLKAWYCPKDAGSSVRPSTKTVFRYTDSHWFEFDYLASVVKAPIINDPNHEVVFTANDGLHYTRNSVATSRAPYPSTSYKLGIPQPAKPSISGGDSRAVSDTDVDVEDVAYAVTWVDAFGREGPASPASSVARVKQTKSTRTAITINRPAQPSGNYNFGRGAVWRIYRTNTASDGSGVWQYVADVPYTTDRYTDTRRSEDVLEEMSTTDWFGPPDDNRSLWPSGPAKGVVSVANSYLACFTGRTLCFSVPNVPHAWPPSFQIVVEYDIVGLASVGTDLVVLTKGHPYVVTGGGPGNLQAIKLPDPQACVSAQSIVALEDGVMYASPDGLCIIRGYRSELVSSDVFDERTWASLKPASVNAAYYEGMYLFTCKDATKCYIYVPNAKQQSLREVNFLPKVMYTDLATDTLYYHEGDGRLKAFNKGDGKFSYKWESGRYDMMRPVNMSWGRVYASDYPVTFKLKSRNGCANERVETYTAHCSKPFRLKGGFLSTEYSLLIESDKTVHDIQIANNLSEFGAV
ncbi:hypothetical protein HPC37_02780 [Pasteurellaceae bacterium 20609_3]|uniref:hypothetical protein n=1 Tax=Spirabiliibacterium mucosae TaxID=28156 RepID=UPI001AAD6C32|nr:hypothetical protein [Spirabiliibacterium mucosae]MBE2897779.1 hypothetical protein [Spirabiliibacterium mucosae]